MDWFERVTGFPERDYSATQAGLQVREGRLCPDTAAYAYAVGRLELVSLAELRRRAAAVSLSGGLNQLDVPGDTRQLHADPRFRGALFQVASQFNLLEMIGPDITPERGVSGYAFDRTQGPACAMAAGAGTIYRNYLVPVEGGIGQTAQRQLNALADLEAELASQLDLPAGSLWEMRNGYALPDATHLALISQHLAGQNGAQRDQLRQCLRIGLHWDVEVTEEGVVPGTYVSQAYCSAMPVKYSGISAEAWAPLASLILEAAYEATLLAGLLNAARGASSCVLLTRLGGGAFGNQDAWIDAALASACELCSEFPLKLCHVIYAKS